jgi:hypothetical protein
MNLGAIFLLLGVLVFVGLFVAQPFTRNWRIKPQGSHEISTLLAERERALTALQELDFDNGIGKIPEEEYSAQRASLIQKGADILRRLDEIQSAKPAAEKASPGRPASESHAEVLSDDEVENIIAKRRAGRQHKTAGFCPYCGKPILLSDQFCPSCGQMVNSKVSQP